MRVFSRPRNPKAMSVFGLQVLGHFPYPLKSTSFFCYICKWRNSEWLALKALPLFPTELVSSSSSFASSSLSSSSLSLPSPCGGRGARGACCPMKDEALSLTGDPAGMRPHRYLITFPHRPLKYHQVCFLDLPKDPLFSPLLNSALC